MYKETRKIQAADVRSLCISQGWYSAGTVKAYDNLLSYVYSLEEENITTEILEKLAYDIKSHTSNPEWEDTDLETYMYYLAKICYSIFEKVE